MVFDWNTVVAIVSLFIMCGAGVHARGARKREKKLQEKNDQYENAEAELKKKKKKDEEATKEEVRVLKLRVDAVEDRQIVFGKDLQDVEKIENCVKALKKDVQKYKLEAATRFMLKSDHDRSMTRTGDKIEKLTTVVTNCRCGKSN